MASIFDEIQRERAALLKAIDGLDGAELERPGMIGRWSIKDTLAHLAGWQEWTLRVYPARLEHGQIPEDMRVTEENVDEWNRRFVDERQGSPPDKVLEELSDGVRRLMIFAANLGTTRLAAANPWPGREASITDYLREHLVGHDREHRQQIERALSRRPRAV